VAKKKPSPESFSPAGKDADQSAISIREFADLPGPEQAELQGLAGPDDPVQAVVASDLLSTGRYGHRRLLLCEQSLAVVEAGAVDKRVALGQVVSVQCREFVGNGALEVRLEDGRRVELIRYSRTVSEPFQEIADRVNAVLRVSEDELQVEKEELAKVSGPREEKLTFRCPNCGHPLAHASDVCPRCTRKREVMLRLLGFLKQHRPLVVWGLLLSMLATVTALGPGILMRQLVDTSLNATDVDLATRRARLYVIVALFFGLATIGMITSHFRIKVMGTLGERVVSDLRGRLYRALQRLSLSYYDREHTGRIMARVLTDTRVVQRFIVQGVQRIIIDLLKIIGIFIILFSIAWPLATLALLPVPLVVLFGKHFSRRFRNVFRAVRRRFATLSAAVAESISGVRVVKSFAQEDREIDGFNEKIQDVYDARMSVVRTKARFNPLVAFLMGAGILAVWLVGGGEVLGGALTLGTLFLFLTYMQQFYGPVEALLYLTESFQESATAAERVFSVLDMPGEVMDHDKARVLDEVRGLLEIQNISFQYPDQDRVLKDIDLVIKPGEMLGLVGQTGSGKSTLVSLICRFYDPTKGRITLDGVDLRDIKTKWLRQNIGMVLQETFLFAGTIRENIAYGRPEATDEEIIRAAKAANAHDFVMNLADGYDREVGERGTLLSGGEKQRLAIARAVLKDPAILILDEATSAVDTATEALIQEAMDRLVQGRTTIAIAHRLSTLRNADRLVVIEGGEIIEQGTHEELLAQGGTYAELCRIQGDLTGDSAGPKAPDSASA